MRLSENVHNIDVYRLTPAQANSETVKHFFKKAAHKLAKRLAKDSATDKHGINSAYKQSVLFAIKQLPHSVFVRTMPPVGKGWNAWQANLTSGQLYFQLLLSGDKPIEVEEPRQEVITVGAVRGHILLPTTVEGDFILPFRGAAFLTIPWDSHSFIQGGRSAEKIKKLQQQGGTDAHRRRRNRHAVETGEELAERVIAGQRVGHPNRAGRLTRACREP